MRFLMLTACVAAAACVSAAPGAASTSPWTHSPRTIVCNFSEIHVSWGTSRGGTFYVTNGANGLLIAWVARGILRRIDTHCKPIRTRALPRPVLPRPNYAMGPGVSYDCSSRGSVLIHARFLRSGGRVTGLYVSVRERRTGRLIAGGLFTLRAAREYIGPTCVG